MATLNTIFAGRDNAVEIVFSGVDLTLFTKVEATFGADTRATDTDPDDVIVVSATELRLKFGDTAETQANYWRIVGYDAGNPAGVVLTSECVGNLDPSPICT